MANSKDRIVSALMNSRDQASTDHWSDALMPTFIWGNGGRRLTPGQIDRDNKMSALLMKQGTDYSPIQHWTQGGARVMAALAGVVRERRAVNAEHQMQENREREIKSFFPQQSAPDPSAPPASPQAPRWQFAPPSAPSEAPTTPSMQEAPQSQQQQTPAPVNGHQNSGTNLSLDPQSVNRIKKTLMTEVIAGLPEAAYNEQAAGIVDTIMNRVVSGQWGNNIRSVVNAPYQFSDINGPVSWRRHGRRDVDQITDAWLESPAGRRASGFVDDYLAKRSANAAAAENIPNDLGSSQFQQLVGGHLNYANPHYSDASNLPWINKLDGPRLGVGKAIHHHGTAGNQRPVDPTYTVNLSGQPQQAAAPQSAPLFLGDSHAPALAQFGKGKSQGVNGATIAQAIQQLQKAPRGANVVMSAGTNDAVGQFNEQAIRAQVQQAAQLAKQNGINLTWAGPTGPNASALDAILSDATKTNGINYRSMVGGNFAMQPDGIHAQLNPQGYGAMWDAINKQPQAQPPQQPYQVASLSPIGLPEQQQAQVPPSVPQQAQAEQPAPEQVAQLSQGPQSVNDFGFRAPVQAQAPQQAPQVAPQPQAAPQQNIPPHIIRGLASQDPVVRAAAAQAVSRMQPQNEVKVLPNGDVVSVDKRTNRVSPLYSAPKTNFGVIGKDEYGRDKYGFINPQKETVSPYNAPQQQPQGPSVIPPTPNGVDPAAWKKYWSEKLSKDSLGPTEDDVSKLRNEIRQLPSYKAMAEVAPRYNGMVKAFRNDNRAADLTLVYGLMKILDPTSVVRESEAEMAQKIATVPEQFRAQVHSFLTGTGRLAPEVRAAMMKEAFGAAHSYREMFDRDAKFYDGIIQRRRINRADVLPEFEPFAEFAPSTPQNPLEDEMKRRGLLK